MFARASREIDAKGKFDAGSTRVEEDGAIVGTCAGSNPGDSYDVRVRVLGKDETFAFAAGSAATADDGGSVNPSNPSKPVNPVNPMSPHDARLVDVSCTCPAARAQARGADPAPRFGARSAAPPRAPNPSAALLLALALPPNRRFTLRLRLRRHRPAVATAPSSARHPRHPRTPSRAPGSAYCAAAWPRALPRPAPEGWGGVVRGGIAWPNAPKRPPSPAYDTRTGHGRV